MTQNRLIAASAIVGATIITVADMPNWTVEPYIGWVAATTGIAILGQFAPDVAKGMGVLMMAALLLSRGPDAAKNIDKLLPRAGRGRGSANR